MKQQSNATIIKIDFLKARVLLIHPLYFIYLTETRVVQFWRPGSGGDMKEVWDSFSSFGGW